MGEKTKKQKKNIKKKIKILEKNKWGFTLVELLGVIVIIALVVGGGVFGIIKLIDKSREDSTNISVESIKKAATTYSTEKNNNDDYWIEMTRKGYEGKYFCVTVEELINKGLLPKDKDLGNIDIHTYVGIRKNNITLVNGNPILLKNTPLNEENNSLTEEQIIYGVCTGNIINEAITKHPILSGGTSYTDEIVNISFSDIEGENIKIKESTCSYGLTSSNLNQNGTISGNTCSFNNLKDNTPYYVRVCTFTEGGSIACSDTIAKNTAKIKNPSINLSDKVKITYDNSNIKGDSYYYFKSSINATSDINVSSCTLNNDNTFNCNNDSVKNISSNTWYRSTNQTVNLTYSTSGKVNVIARTYDKSNNYAESKKDFNVYKAIFKKGSVDKIGNGTTDITKICLAEVKGTCTIKSPTIEKLGYNAVGWNTNASAITSSWNVNTDKNNTSGTYYPIVKAKTIKVTFHRYTSKKDKKTATQTFTYGVSGQSFNDKGWTNTGYTMAGWEKREPKPIESYGVNATVRDTWINRLAPEIHLYAVWSPNTYTISYNANGGTGAPAEQKKTYGTDLKLSSTKPTKTGYDFNGWNTKKDGTGSNFAAGSNYTANGNATLYAMWKVKTIKVVFHRNTSAKDTTTVSKTFTYGVSGQKFSNNGWSRKDYLLYGWAFANDACEKAYDVDNKVFDSWIDKRAPEIHLYAVWKKTNFTIKYDANGGTGAPATQTKKAGASIKISSVIPKRENYVFSHWNTSPLGVGHGEWFNLNETYSRDADLTLYAQWDKEILILESVEIPKTIKYNKETDFKTKAYFTTLINTNLDKDKFVLEAYSEDCALKSWSGRGKNCQNEKWVDYYNSIYINSFYYTNNDNVYTHTSSDNTKHCIKFRGRIGTFYTENEKEYCYEIEG